MSIQKRKSLSTFTHAPVVPNLLDISWFFKEDILKNFGSRWLCYLVPHIRIIFCDQQKTSIQVWNKFTCYMVSWCVIFLQMKSFSFCFSDFLMEFSSPFPDTEIPTSLSMCQMRITYNSAVIPKRCSFVLLLHPCKDARFALTFTFYSNMIYTDLYCRHNVSNRCIWHLWFIYWVI